MSKLDPYEEVSEPYLSSLTVTTLPRSPSSSLSDFTFQGSSTKFPSSRASALVSLRSSASTGSLRNLFMMFRLILKCSGCCWSSILQIWIWDFGDLDLIFWMFSLLRVKGNCRLCSLLSVSYRTLSLTLAHWLLCWLDGKYCSTARRAKCCSTATRAGSGETPLVWCKVNFFSTGQSEASVQVTWSVMTNQRSVFFFSIRTKDAGSMSRIHIFYPLLDFIKRNWKNMRVHV